MAAWFYLPCILKIPKIIEKERKFVGDSEIARRDHQRNKSEIVKLVKEMFDLEKWGDEEYKKKLQELVIKDDDLIRDVIRKIKLEKGLE